MSSKRRKGEGGDLPASGSASTEVAGSALGDMRRLWDFAETLPQDFTLRVVLLKERENLTAQEFAAKVGVWLEVLDIDLRRERSKVKW